MSENSGDSTVSSVDTNRVPWFHIPVPEIDHELPVKMLIDDPDTGMSILKMKYVAGFRNPWHTHNCAHGMYVLDGILETHKGSYGPGEFVWFPEGERVFHGATPDNDATFLFIANKTFDIHHEEQAGGSR